jgi:hypothetical protein
MRTRLVFATQIPANTFAGAVHTRMIASNRDYATAASRGQIARWAFSYQDLDANGQPIGTNWHVNVKARCNSVLTPSERALIVSNGS